MDLCTQKNHKIEVNHPPLPELPRFSGGERKRALQPKGRVKGHHDHHSRRHSAPAGGKHMLRACESQRPWVPLCQARGVCEGWGVLFVFCQLVSEHSQGLTPADARRPREVLPGPLWVEPWVLIRELGLPRGNNSCPFKVHPEAGHKVHGKHSTSEPRYYNQTASASFLLNS